MTASKYLFLFALILPLSALANTKSDFTDTELQNLLRSQKAGAIYIWSPHMNYSKLGRVVIRKVCKELGIHLTMLLDPNATEEDGERNQSLTLMKMGAGLHFPGLHLFKDGAVLSDNLMGAKSYPDYKNYIAKQLKLEVRDAQSDSSDPTRSLQQHESCRLGNRALDCGAESAELLLSGATE